MLVYSVGMSTVGGRNCLLLSRLLADPNLGSSSPEDHHGKALRHDVWRPQLNLPKAYEALDAYVIVGLQYRYILSHKNKNDIIVIIVSSPPRPVSVYILLHQLFDVTVRIKLQQLHLFPQPLPFFAKTTKDRI